MYRENAFLTNTQVIAAPEAAKKCHSGSKQAVKLCSYNLLLFGFPEVKPIIRFTTEDHPGSIRFSLKALPEEARQQFLVDGVPAEYVYSNFMEDAPGIPVETDLGKHPAVARAWFTHRLNRVMRLHADVVIPNFLHDTVCWFKTKDETANNYYTYKKFSLRVQFHPENGTPELLISFDGFSNTTKQPVSALAKQPAFHSGMVHNAVFRGGCYLVNRLPEAARYHQEEVFPLLNGELKQMLKIYIPVKSNKEKHQQFKNEVKWFYQHYAKLEEFKDAIPHQGRFREVDDGDVFSITIKDDLLEFGEGNTSREIYNGFRDHGPARLPECQEVTCFYIYASHQKDVMLAFDSTMGGHAPWNNELTRFTRVPIVREERLDIVFDENNKPLETILNKIQLLETKPGRSYYAFFINPWTKFESDRMKHSAYFRVKEALLLRNIMMQNMDAAKLENGNLKFFMPNLAAAMTGKLGGTPWRLKRPHTGELIVGFGVFRSRKYNLKYTGSSVCFANDGTFGAFDCFRADDGYAIAATVEKAIIKYVEAYRKPERLVIHFYRKLSPKALKPVEKMLRELKLDIPVIVVCINKTYSGNITAFKHNDTCSMPERGTVINYRPCQYLLFLNDRLPEQQTFTGPMPMPLKISILTGRTQEQPDKDTVATLMQQVYDFCFLYYRAVKHARLPVTILYPEMLASMVPYFRDDVLQEERAGKMIFL